MTYETFRSRMAEAAAHLRALGREIAAAYAEGSISRASGRETGMLGFGLGE